MNVLDLLDSALVHFVQQLLNDADDVGVPRLNYTVVGKHDDDSTKREERRAFLDELLPELEEALQLWVRHKLQSDDP